MKNNNLIAVHGKISSGKDTIGNIIQIITALPHLTDTGVKSFLGREIDSPYQIKKFADKLKDIICILIGCTREQLEVREFKEAELGEEWWYYTVSYRCASKETEGGLFATKEEALKYYYSIGGKKDDLDLDIIKLVKPTLRLLMQLLGTEAGRNIIHPNLWVNSLFADYTQKFTGKTFHADGIGRVVQQHEYPNWIITDLRFPNELEAIKERNGIIIRVNKPCEECGVIEGHKMIPHKTTPSTHESETALDSYQDWDYVINNDSDIPTLIKKVREILNKENII